MKDLPKQSRCASAKTTAIGEVSCSSNNIEHVINDPVAARRKGRPPCLRKQSSLRKKPAQKNKTTEKNKDLQENASVAFEMANEISTLQSNIQQSNMAMVPVYPFQVGGNNIYQSIPYSWHMQPVPPYALQSHYSSLLMTYEGSASGNFQQCNEDNNRRN
ncbi:hypothetical protein WN944_005665 [Citrus x changshan-huyou]|uniref:Uncharacterized protein n=1 Tax=Citrus x changshan-huyou TaxID=2935761 RepID=A0AAP0MMV7_9ROSI